MLKKIDIRYKNTGLEVAPTMARASFSREGAFHGAPNVEEVARMDGGARGIDDVTNT